MEKKKVSIVIPAYNAEKFIKETLASAMQQTYDNYELLVINDGSSDSTEAVCQGFAKADERIRVITKENGGVSSARNLGIREAKGDYIVFFDDDDYAEPELLENYVAAYEQWQDKEVSFVTCGMFYDNVVNKRVEDKKSILESAHGYIEGENYYLARCSVATLTWLRLFNFVTNKCYKLDAIKENCIYFDENINIGEDLKFNLDYLDKCEGNIGMINKALYHYVKRTGNSLSLSYHTNDLEDTKAVYNRLINWEKVQQGATTDNILVLKAIFIYDWTSRLTALYQNHKKEPNFSKAKRVLSKELRSHEFQRMLREVYRAGKISKLRYMCLRTGRFEIFYFFRGIYQIIKG